MKTKPAFWYCQSAAAPVRIVDGRMEVLLVTARRSGRWIVPKGIIEPGMTPAGSAAQEAWEEAGVTGTMNPRSLGHYTIRKWGGECSVEVFSMDAVQEADRWPEDCCRQRKWFLLGDAMRIIYPAGAAAILRNSIGAGLLLTLVRHAKSSWDDPDLDDRMRPLNDRGLKDAPAMGRWLRTCCAQPDLIVSSPARRALHTATIMADIFAYSEEDIIQDKRVYAASSEALLQRIRRLPDNRHNVMVVGHNPGLENLVKFFLRRGITILPTCGVVQVIFNTCRWRDIDPQCAALLMFDYPRHNPAVA